MCYWYKDKCIYYRSANRGPQSSYLLLQLLKTAASICLCVVITTELKVHVQDYATHSPKMLSLCFIK